MKQPLTVMNHTDINGCPLGGRVNSCGLSITWQKGPLGRDDARLEPNGCFVETVIQAAKQRLEYYQGSKFNCPENAIAILKLTEALEVLEARTPNREARKVEGTLVV